MEVSYSTDKKNAFVDGIRFTRDDASGHYLSSRNTYEGHRERLHMYMWRTRNGEIPAGMQVHHVDEDKGNNEVENLALLDSVEHHRLRGEPLSDEERDRRRRNLIENAIPKAAEWHRSEEGRAWHRAHGGDAWKDRVAERYVCTMCGATFESRRRYGDNQNKFCSNRCKSAFRRMMGYDNVERTCSICGNTFTTNKYSKATRCKDCAHKR